MNSPDAPQIRAPMGDARTDRLRLTPLSAGDTDGLAQVFAEPAVWEFPFGRGMGAAWTAGFVTRAVDHWHQFGFGLWTVRPRTDETVIGYLGLSIPAFLSDVIPTQRMPAVEIGWRLHPGYWGKGLATEAAQTALQEAFETLGLSEVCSAPQTTNPRSARVAQRIGMRYERTAMLPATDTRDAVEIDLYWITRQQWLTSS